MTPEEKYAESLLREAKEINFQYEILIRDIDWIKEKMQALYACTQRAKNIKELEFLMNKFRINVEARDKVKTKTHEVGAKINAFFGKKLWGD